VPDGTAHNTPVQGLCHMPAATAGSCSGTVATARSRLMGRHDDLDTLTTTLMDAAMRPASSMGYQVCASHEKKRLVSLGQQQRQRQWWQELLGADSIPAAMTHPQDDSDIIFRRRSHSESYCVVRCTWLILAAAAFREPLTPSAAHSTQRALTSGDHEQRRVVVDKCAGIPAKISRLPSRLGPGRVDGREERPYADVFRPTMISVPSLTCYYKKTRRSTLVRAGIFRLNGRGFTSEG